MFLIIHLKLLSSRPRSKALKIDCMKVTCGFLLYHKKLKGKKKLLFIGLLHRVVWWLKTKVSEAVLPPSSRLKCVVKKMHLSTALIEVERPPKCWYPTTTLRGG